MAPEKPTVPDVVEPPPAPPSGWVLARDIGVFQLKLLVDGLRDLVLLPASLVAGIISLASAENRRAFYEVVNVGRQSERWINLFGALRNAPPDVVDDHTFGDRDIDDLVSKVEHFVVDEYQRGGVTKQAKSRLDQALAALQRQKKESR